MREAHGLADLIAELLNTQGAAERIDGGADFRILVTDRAANVAEVQLYKSDGARGARWGAEDGFDRPALASRLQPQGVAIVDRPWHRGAFAVAGVAWNPEVFTGTTFCSGCRSKIRSADGIQTWTCGDQLHRICGTCADILQGIRVGRKFRLGMGDVEIADIERDRIVMAYNGTEVGHCSAVDFTRAFGGWVE